jgi:hypothetical protein
VNPNDHMEDVVYEGGWPSKDRKGKDDDDGCLMVAVVPVIALLLIVLAICV